MQRILFPIFIKCLHTIMICIVIVGYLDELKSRKGQKYLEDSIFCRIFAADKYKLKAI